jgi:hypothetical protein
MAMILHTHVRAAVRYVTKQKLIVVDLILTSICVDSRGRKGIRTWSVRLTDPRPMIIVEELKALTLSLHDLVLRHLIHI